MKLYGFEFLADGSKPKVKSKLKSKVKSDSALKKGSRGRLKNSKSSFEQWIRPPFDERIFANPGQFIQTKPIINYKGHSKSKTLILSGDSISAGYLCEKLRQNKKSFTSINLDEFIYSGHVSYSSKNGIELQCGAHSIKLNNMTNVLYMPPHWLVGLEAHSEMLTLEEKVFLSRWKTALESLEILGPSRRWFPSQPRELYESRQQKLSDLAQAQRLGIKVPETIMTMDPNQAKHFVKRHKGSVIFREFSLRRIYKKSKVLTFDVDFVKTNSRFWKYIRLSPTILQQYIEKRMEYRVVVVGKKCFVCEIDSQNGLYSKKDWRAYEFESVEFKQGSLPMSVRKKLIQYAERQGFKYCTFDLIKDKKNQYYFLEMNRPGSWLFVEGLTGLPISKAIVKMLN